MGYICQLGYYNFLNDSFTLSVDLNDGVNLELDEDAGGGLDLPTPDIDVFSAGNMRMAGERVQGQNYAAREITVDLMMGPQATYAALQAIIQSITKMQEAVRIAALQALSGLASGSRVVLKLAPPGSATPLYADILALHADHAAMGDAESWVRLVQDGITIECLCAPFLRGPRVTLMNALSNPGFEAPAQSYATVFNDGFATANAYTVQGSSPTLSANVLTLSASSSIQFGTSAWQAVAHWRLRWKWVTGLTALFDLHLVDTNNYTQVSCDGTNIYIKQTIAGVTTTLKTVAAALTSGNWYWVDITQFPNMPTVAPLVQAIIAADSAGAYGATVATAGPVVLGSASQVIAGVMRIGATAQAMSIGGAYSSVHFVQLFGPGGWTLFNNGTGLAVGSWNNSSANGYQGGPVTSYGAAALMAAPAGTLDAYWASANLSNTTTVQATALPASPGQVWNMAGWVISVGVGAGCVQALYLNEYDSGGNFLRSTSVGAVTGAQGAYVQVSGQCTVGSSCAYIALLARATDGTTGSAGGVVTWDNMQLWLNTYGATMPYCEMSMASAPGQIVLSGLLGDVPAPCHFMVGINPSGGSIAPGTSLALYAGRRAQAGAGARLVGAGVVAAPDGVNDSMVLDTSCWSGYRAVYKNVAGDYEPVFVSGQVGDCLGMYHLLLRAKVVDTPSTSQNMNALAYLLQSAWLGNAAHTDRLGVYQSPFIFPFTGTGFTIVDAGQVTLPPFPLATMADPTQIYTTAAAQCTTASTEMDADWGALVPVDGDLLAAKFQPSSTTTLTGWIWLYFDGLSMQNAGQASVGFSVESGPLANAAHAGGGAYATVAPGVTSVGDAVPRIDPQVATVNAAGVNQWVVVAYDSSANVLPIACMVSYAPLYLQLR
jgi:hypothetical protein